MAQNTPKYKNLYLKVHGASIENDESTDSSLGRQSLSREDTMESLLSSPDMDSAIWSVNLEALTGSWKSPRRFSLEVVEIRSEIPQRYRNKKTEEAFLLRLLEDTWLNKDDSIDSVFMPGPGSSTGSKTLEQILPRPRGWKHMFCKCYRPTLPQHCHHFWKDH